MQSEGFDDPDILAVMRQRRMSRHRNSVVGPLKREKPTEIKLADIVVAEKRAAVLSKQRSLAALYPPPDSTTIEADLETGLPAPIETVVYARTLDKTLDPIGIIHTGKPGPWKRRLLRLTVPSPEASSPSPVFAFYRLEKIRGQALAELKDAAFELPLNQLDMVEQRQLLSPESLPFYQEEGENLEKEYRYGQIMMSLTFVTAAHVPEFHVVFNSAGERDAWYDWFSAYIVHSELRSLTEGAEQSTETTDEQKYAEVLDCLRRAPFSEFQQLVHSFISGAKQKAEETKNVVQNEPPDIRKPPEKGDIVQIVSDGKQEKKRLSSPSVGTLCVAGRMVGMEKKLYSMERSTIQVDAPWSRNIYILFSSTEDSQPSPDQDKKGVPGNNSRKKDSSRGGSESLIELRSSTTEQRDKFVEWLLVVKGAQQATEETYPYLKEEKRKEKRNSVDATRSFYVKSPQSPEQSKFLSDEAEVVSETSGSSSEGGENSPRPSPARNVSEDPLENTAGRYSGAFIQSEEMRFVAPPKKIDEERVVGTCRPPKNKELQNKKEVHPSPFNKMNKEILIGWFFVDYRVYGNESSMFPAFRKKRGVILDKLKRLIIILDSFETISVSLSIDDIVAVTSESFGLGPFEIGLHTSKGITVRLYPVSFSSTYSSYSLWLDVLRTLTKRDDRNPENDLESKRTPFPFWGGFLTVEGRDFASSIERKCGSSRAMSKCPLCQEVLEQSLSCSATSFFHPDFGGCGGDNIENFLRDPSLRLFFEALPVKSVVPDVNSGLVAKIEAELVEANKVFEALGWGANK